MTDKQKDVKDIKVIDDEILEEVSGGPREILSIALGFESTKPRRPKTLRE